MRLVSRKPPIQIPQLIADRYRVRGLIGQGGMAGVYKVYDISTRRDLALKQLVAKGGSEKQRKIVELFEREYLTLAHLAHPRVVQVYDYGVDGRGPYYTMELLDGTDLRKLSPVPWRRACGLLIDVCSVLSLIHSRKLVHRDISPANIWCTHDGLAKLIDFGAMIPMGPCRQVVGTAAFSAPEMVNLQSLDGRVDLYSLGAALYYTLTGRHAYAARDFKQLRQRWRIKPSVPSTYVKDIPKALDVLTTSLIHLDPQARPTNAAEVIDRLSAIADIKVAGQLKVSQAYLTSPTLVGRDKPLFRLKKRLILSPQRKGSTVVVQGVSGVGRSRFIEACTFEGKLIGATVLRSDASDAQTGDYGVVRSLVKQIIDAFPDTARKELESRVADLRRVLPDLFRQKRRVKLELAEPTADIRARVQSQLCEWFIDLSQSRCLCIAVDDVHRIDEPSAAFLAYLSHQLETHAIVIVVSAETNAPCTAEGALEVLVRNGTVINLKNLSQNKTEQLLASIFGKVPNIDLVSHHLFRISAGIPRDILQLAQHLVDRRAIRFDAGVWLLPDRIDSGDLPDSMAQTLRDRVDMLSYDARHLATHMALSPEENFSFDDCIVLTQRGEVSRVMSSLQELVTAEVLKNEQDRYAFTQRGWANALTPDNNSVDERECHLRLVGLYSRRGNQPLHVVRHLLRAGEQEKALDLLIQFSESTQRVSGDDQEVYHNLVRSLPHGWRDIFTDGIELCEKVKRPKSQIYTLYIRLVGLIRTYDASDTQPFIRLYQMLYRDSGLAFYRELDQTIESDERVKVALKKAQDQYDTAAEADKGLEPIAAIRELVRSSILASGMIAISCDYPFHQSVPSLEPYGSLSPAVDVTNRLLRAVGRRITMRNDLALQKYEQILAMIDKPDRGGLEESYHTHVRYGIKRGLGMIRACMGLEDALLNASELESHPIFEVNAIQIQMLYYTWQGDVERAIHYKKSMELLQIQKSPMDFYEGSYQAREFVAYAIIDDLSSVKFIMNGIDKMAEKYPAWFPTQLYAHGEYHRIRGDYPKAMKKFEEALQLTAAGKHQSWADIAGAYLRTLSALHRYQEGAEKGEKFRALAEREQLGFTGVFIAMPLAMADAMCGNFHKAVVDSEAVIDQLNKTGTTGITLGLAYETRCRIAIRMNDRESYRKYIALCEKQFRRKENPALVARFENVVREAQNAANELYSDRDMISLLLDTDPSSVTQNALEVLEKCKGGDELNRCILDLLIEISRTKGGFLYTMHNDGVRLAANKDSRKPPNDMDEMVRQFVAVESNESADVTMTSLNLESKVGFGTRFAMQTGEQYRPILLAHNTDAGFGITGVAVLLLESEDKFRYPSDVVEIISRFLAESGFTNTLVTVY